MTRFILWLSVILAGVGATIVAVVQDAHSWVERLDDPNTFVVVATQTKPLLLEEDTHLATKNPSSSKTEVVTKVTPVDTTQKKAPSLPVVQKPQSPAPKDTQAPVVSASGPQGVGKINEKTIIDLTNVERVRDGQTVLVWNNKLSEMAYIKAKDMLDKQYFAHESPDGRNVVGLANGVGYMYRYVGENLAVGNFRTNDELIAGWMGSPGHRENILKPEYTEMGAAGIEGIYEGERVWMAVQEFGTPMPQCEKPDIAQKTYIDSIEEQLKALEEGILLAEKVATETQGEARRQKIDDYNALVATYNNLVAEVKALIVTYNNSVRVYNDCIES